MSTPEDQSRWIAHAQAGDPESFSRLVHAHQKVVYAFLMGWVRDTTVADELTQDTFVRAWKAIAKFRGESAFQSWLLQIALNNARSWGRWRSVRLRRDVPLSDPEADEPAAMPTPRAPLANDPAQALDTQELGRHIRRAVELLPPREKTVFVLRHDNELPLKEIATVMGIAEGSVKAHLSHALDKIRKILKEADAL